MVISSRTPAARPDRCLFCGASRKTEPDEAAGGHPCPRCGSLLRFDDRPEGEVATLRLGDKLVTSENLQGLVSWAKARPDEPLVIDFSNATYLTSAAFALLIELKRKLDGNLALVSLSADLLEVFRITRLGTFFDLGEL